MGVKTAGVGHFQIPTAPAGGTSVVSGTANTLTGTAVAMSASVSAMYITGVHVETSAALAATYILVQLCVGAGGAETSIGQYLVPLSTGSTVALGFRPIYPAIPMSAGQRLSVKTADSVGSKTYLVTAECILQSNVVDDAIPVTTVTTVTNQLTAPQIATGVWQDATSGDFTTASSIGKSLYTTGATPGAAGGLQIAGSNAATTYASLTSTGAFSVNGVSAVSQTGDAFARLGAPAGASVSADIAAAKVDTAAIKTKTDFLPSATAGAAGGVFIAGTNAATSITTALTANITGNVSGSVGSVSGAVASVTARVTANTDQLAGQTVTAAAGVTFPTSVASPTNITAGTITTVTNLTNAPTAGDLTAAMKTSVTSAATAATPTAAAVTGAVGSVTAGVTLGNVAHGGAAATLTLGGVGGLTATHTGNTTGSLSGSVGSVTGNVGGNVTGSVGSVVGAVGSVTGLTASNLDVAVSSRSTFAGGAVASVTADVGITQVAADKVWGSAARILTAGTNIVLAKGTGLTGLNDIAATAIVSSGAITTSAGKVSGVALVDTVTTYTGNTPQTGDSFARIGLAGAGLTSLGDTRIANLDAAVSSRTKPADTQAAVTTVTNLTNAPTIGDLTAAMKASVTTAASAATPTIASVAGSVGSVTTPVDANVVKVNGVVITGSGTARSPWGP